MIDDSPQFHVPDSMTPEELGDSLARLVWESFSDMLTEREPRAIFSEFGLLDEEGVPTLRTTEELLIVLLWAHTRSVQLGFVGRTPDQTLKAGLDALHRAVFEDLVEHGTAEEELPLFEQRMAARYLDYNEAAEDSDRRVAALAADHLVPGAPPKPLTELLLQRVRRVASPLKDFLEEVELVS